MTIQTQTITLTLDQVQKRLALRAQLTNDLLKKVENIEEEYPKHVNELRETITSQAERIKELETALRNERAARQEEGAVLRGELAAESAKESNRQQEIAWYLTALDKDEKRIAELTILYDKYYAEANNLRDQLSASKQRVGRCRAIGPIKR